MLRDVPKLPYVTYSKKQVSRMDKTAITTILNKSQARKLTERINKSAGDLCMLMADAYNGKVWVSLGYESWRDYAVSEFSISKSRAYQLLDQAKIISAIKEIAVSTNVEISESTARAIKPVLHTVIKGIEEKVSRGADPLETTYEVIEATLAKPKSSVPTKGAPKLDAEPEHFDGPDLATIVDELQRENEALRAEIAASEADDLKAEAIKWRRAYEHAKREHGIAMDRAAQSQKREKYTIQLLRRCGKAVGIVDPAHTDPKDIAKMVEDSHKVLRSGNGTHAQAVPANGV